MRPEPSKPGRGLSFAGAYFSKVQRSWCNQPKVTQGAGRVQCGRWWGVGVTLCPSRAHARQLQPE